MFSGFEASAIDVGETTIFMRCKGRGRPLLLLHGFPQTHLMWHRVAPMLARGIHSRLCRSSRLWIERQASFEDGSRAILEERNGS